MISIDPYICGFYQWTIDKSRVLAPQLRLTTRRRVTITAACQPGQGQSALPYEPVRCEAEATVEVL